MTKTVMTREQAIDALVQCDVDKWGEAEREASRAIYARGLRGAPRRRRLLHCLRRGARGPGAVLRRAWVPPRWLHRRVATPTPSRSPTDPTSRTPIMRTLLIALTLTLTLGACICPDGPPSAEPIPACRVLGCSAASRIGPKCDESGCVCPVRDAAGHAQGVACVPDCGSVGCAAESTLACDDAGCVCDVPDLGYGWVCLP
jgi:hypothetical protein